MIDEILEKTSQIKEIKNKNKASKFMLSYWKMKWNNLCHFDGIKQDKNENDEDESSSENDGRTIHLESVTSVKTIESTKEDDMKSQKKLNMIRVVSASSSKEGELNKIDMVGPEIVWTENNKYIVHSFICLSSARANEILTQKGLIHQKCLGFI